MLLHLRRGLLSCLIVPRSLNHHVTSRPCLIFRQFCQWDLVSAVCLERIPIITKELCDVERRRFELMQQIEYEKSYLSDHEIQHLQDIKRAENLKKGIIEDADAASKQTAQDFEEQSLKEFNSFQSAPRITDADSRNDLHSIHRKLDQALLLVVKQMLGNEFRWILPQAVHIEGETLRETAERALRLLCCDQMMVQFHGNAPVGYYKYKYPKATRDNGVCGAKVFFFKATHLSGNLSRELLTEVPHVDDFRWLLHSELKDYLLPVYQRSVEPILFPDETVEHSCDSNSQKHETCAN